MFGTTLCSVKTPTHSFFHISCLQVLAGAQTRSCRVLFKMFYLVQFKTMNKQLFVHKLSSITTDAR